jgi:hypothetical protein
VAGLASLLVSCFRHLEGAENKGVASSCDFSLNTLLIPLSVLPLYK